jgi:hypothetical protein
MFYRLLFRLLRRSPTPAAANCASDDPRQRRRRRPEIEACVRRDLRRPTITASSNALLIRSPARQEKKKKLANTNFFVSRTRLSVRNLSPAVSDAALRALFHAAAAEARGDRPGPAPTVEQARVVRDKDRPDPETGKVRGGGAGVGGGDGKNTFDRESEFSERRPLTGK